MSVSQLFNLSLVQAVDASTLNEPHRQGLSVQLIRIKTEDIIGYNFNAKKPHTNLCLQVSTFLAT